MGSLLLFAKWVFWSAAVFVVRLCILQPVCYGYFNICKLFNPVI